MLVAEGAQMRTWAAPGGDLTDPEVRPVEAASRVVEVLGEGDVVTRADQLLTSVVIQLEEGDLEALAETGMFEFGVWGGGLPVFTFVPLVAVPLEGSDDGG
jgi:hypothetical protein